MESDEDDLLLVSDAPCAEKTGYAWSEGGDSLLDSEEEDCEEEVEECLKVPPPVYQESTPSEKCSASPPQQSASDRPPQSQSESHHSSGRSRVIRLDGQKKFRYVSECLPDVQLPKRALSRAKPAITRPRRLTKPSLLLEPKRRLLTPDPLPDLRNTLVANRMATRNHREFGVMAGARVGGAGVVAGTRAVEEVKAVCSVVCSEEGSEALTHSLSYSWKGSAPQSLFTQTSAPPAVWQTKANVHTTTPSTAQRESPTAAAPPTALCGLKYTPSSGSQWSCDNRSGPAATSDTSQIKNIFSFTSSLHPTSTAGLFERTAVFTTPLPSTSPPPPPPFPPPRQAAHGPLINPFYAKIPKRPMDETFNPFVTALQKEAVMKTEQTAVSDFAKTSHHLGPFSFSLAHITKHV